MTDLPSPRTVDHLVLPVADIDVARSRYQALGFAVAPDGMHPFGTENCCIFFEDGTFLEPLGIAHRETCEEYAQQGNTFVRNDQTYRFRRGTEGFSHIVLKSNDAAEDAAMFNKHGISGGASVHFSRAFESPNGEKGEVSFELAFAADPRAPDAGFFTCEVKNSPEVDRNALLDHANGVGGIREIILSEINPTDFQYFFQTYLNQREMRADSFGMSFATVGSEITVLSPDGMQAFYGMETERVERGLRLQAAKLGVREIDSLAARLTSQDIRFESRGGNLIVAPAPGQGLTLIFEKDPA